MLLLSALEVEVYELAYLTARGILYQIPDDY